MILMLSVDFIGEIVQKIVTVLFCLGSPTTLVLQIWIEIQAISFLREESL